MTIPLFVILIIYLVGLGIFFLLSFFNLYHIIRFGLFDLSAKMMLVFFCVASLAIIVISLIMIREVDWTESLMLFSSDDFRV